MQILRFWNTAFSVLFILFKTGIYTEIYVEERNLLLVRSGTNTSIGDVWTTVGGLNDPGGVGHQQNVHEMIFNDNNFRSSLVDDWNETNCPDNVLLAIHNRYGDELCSMYFNTPSTNWSFNSWFNEPAISGWSYKLPVNAKIQWGRPYFDMYVSDHVNNDAAWIAVGLWDSSFPNLTNHTPMLLCSTNHTSPNVLMKEIITTEPSFTMTVEGCYPYAATSYTLVLTNTTSMTVELCMAQCIPQGSVYAFLESGKKCNCGDITGAAIDSPGHCGGKCAGNNAQVCGTTDGFLVAYATGSVSGTTSTIPSQTGVSYDGVPKSMMATVFHSTVTKAISAGDLNTTIELTSATSESFIYIRAVELSYKNTEGTPVTSTYSVWYQLYPMEHQFWASTFDMNAYPQFYPTDGTRVDLDVLPIWNITFAFSSTPVDGEAVINLYTVGDDEFVTGHLFSIKSFKSIELTTSPEETTTAATTTSATETTTGETSTAEITTHVADTSSVEMTSQRDTTYSETSLVETTTLAGIQSSVGTDTTPVVSTTHQSTVNVSAGLCECMCVTSFINMTAEELEESLQELKKELTVSKTELSSYKRKLISAPDSRQSAASLGGYRSWSRHQICSTTLRLEDHTVRRGRF